MKPFHRIFKDAQGKLGVIVEWQPPGNAVSLKLCFLKKQCENTTACNTLDYLQNWLATNGRRFLAAQIGPASAQDTVQEIALAFAQCEERMQEAT
jgi:hypothetical protein